jgi:para-nitrobenzyl esterase
MAETSSGRRNRAAIAAALGAAVLGAAIGCDRAAEPPVREIEANSRRRIDQGELVGTRGRYGNHAWLGIPFAEAPVGPRRWRAPQPPGGWTGEYRATDMPPVCPQLGSPFGGVVDVEPGSPAGQEDCLYLNVYAPVHEPGSEPLPVMFWIHGGGNVIGHVGFYDGGNLAATENVVVVSTQYRLGPLGWFRHAALREGATEAEQSGNFGTLDLIRALEWVRDNIHAFGGDPDQVTIFGESAGARNVVSLLLAPPAQGLFHGAIAQSGGTDMLSPAEAEHRVDDPQPGLPSGSNEALLKLIVRDGLADDRGGAVRHLAALEPNEVAAYLRSRSPADLLAVYQADDGEGLIRVANVFADGAVITAGNAVVNFASRRDANVPVIFGTNRDEQKIFMFADPRWTRRWFGIVPRLRDADLYTATADTLSRLWAVRGAIEPATARHAGGQAPSYVYRWDWDEEPTILGADLSQMIGAAHGLEIPFVFGHFYLGPEGERIFDEAGAPGRALLSRAMMSYWAQFARSGDPGRGGDGLLPQWQAWTPEPDADKLLVLDTDAGGGIRMEASVPSRPEIYAALDSDPRIATDERRCRVYATMMEWTREIDEARYRELGCAD